MRPLGSVPDVPVPQVEPLLVALHLSLDDGVVVGRCFLRDWEHLRSLAPNAIQKSQLDVK
jgi:hypothetical protein